MKPANEHTASLAAALIALFGNMDETDVVGIARAALMSLSARWRAEIGKSKPEPLAEFYAVNRALSEVDAVSAVLAKKGSGE